MSAMEKSDLPEVARKRANKAASAAAEPVERRGGVLLFGTDQRITSGPAAKRLRSKAGYMAAPERFAQSQIPLAPRAPSIHGSSRRLLRCGNMAAIPGQARADG